MRTELANTLTLGERIETLMGKTEAGPQGRRLSLVESPDGVKTVVVEIRDKQFEVIFDEQKSNGEGWIWQVTRLDNQKRVQTPERWDLADLEFKHLR